MVRMTYSMSHWLTQNYPELMPLIMFGHLELFTTKMNEEYISWCKTEEGSRYLVGGDKYEEYMRKRGNQ